MSNNPNARELLKEARDTLVKVQDYGDEWGNLIYRIDLELAAPSESAMEAALRDLVRRMRIAGNMVREAMPNSVSVHNWIDVCAEADKTLEAKP